jgi:hypothetical protein
MQGGPYRSPLFPQQDELVLSEPQEFRAFLELFRAALRKNRTMAAVARRFGYAGERPRRDDEIVDLVSSLEGLLLSDIRRGAEYRFRTAIRGALFIDGSGLTAREVKKQLIRGYDVRSAVAHGGTPSESDLKSANGESLTLDEFVEGIEELVRLAVRKAIECVGAGNGWPPDWDALALEGASYPAADA